MVCVHTGKPSCECLMNAPEQEKVGTTRTEAFENPNKRLRGLWFLAFPSVLGFLNQPQGQDICENAIGFTKWTWKRTGLKWFLVLTYVVAFPLACLKFLWHIFPTLNFLLKDNFPMLLMIDILPMSGSKTNINQR